MRNERMEWDMVFEENSRKLNDASHAHEYLEKQAVILEKKRIMMEKNCNDILRDIRDTETQVPVALQALEESQGQLLTVKQVALTKQAMLEAHIESTRKDSEELARCIAQMNGSAGSA